MLRRASFLPALLPAFCAAMLLLCSVEAEAGDAAARHVIGFSPDGRYFAFEQYGELDWSESDSGWSEISIIDTTTDRFVDGTPVRIVDEAGSENLTLEEARRRAAEKMAPSLARHGISHSGMLIAVDPATLPETMIPYADIAAVEEASAKTLPVSSDTAAELTAIRATEIPVASSVDCSAGLDAHHVGDNTGKGLGFRVVAQTQDGRSFVLHADGSLPKSRRCPTSYSLSEAYLFTPKDGTPVLAVLLQVFAQGYEGRDRRFLAVTSPIKTFSSTRD